MRRTLGPVRGVKHNVRYPPFVALPLWRDRWFWGVIALAFGLNAALFGFVAQLYGSLPERIPLYFDAWGEVSRIAPKVSLLIIPGIGAITLAVNSFLGALLHRRERLGAHLLVGVAWVIQLILWLAATAILG